MAQPEAIITVKNGFCSETVPFNLIFLPCCKYPAQEVKQAGNIYRMSTTVPQETFHVFMEALRKGRLEGLSVDNCRDLRALAEELDHRSFLKECDDFINNAMDNAHAFLIRFDEMKTRIEQLEISRYGMESQCAHVSDEIDRLEKRLSAPVACSDTRVSDLSAKVEDLVAKVSALSSTVSTLGSKVSYLDSKASDLEAMFDSLTEDVVKQGNDFKAITDALTERLDAMQKQQDELTKRLGENASRCVHQNQELNTKFRRLKPLIQKMEKEQHEAMDQIRLSTKEASESQQEMVRQRFDELIARIAQVELNQEKHTKSLEAGDNDRLQMLSSINRLKEIGEKHAWSQEKSSRAIRDLEKKVENWDLVAKRLSDQDGALNRTVLEIQKTHSSELTRMKLVMEKIISHLPERRVQDEESPPLAALQVDIATLGRAIEKIWDDLCNHESALKQLKKTVTIANTDVDSGMRELRDRLQRQGDAIKKQGSAIKIISGVVTASAKEKTSNEPNT